MTHYLFAISGYSGSGKDEFGDCLVREFDGIKTGMADSAKRHMADLYGFSREQLFGPSKFRNDGDLRYPKESFLRLGVLEQELVTLKDPEYWLSPRETLQRYCELMNKLYEGSWINNGINIHIQLANDPFLVYDSMQGVIPSIRIPKENVITMFCDVRHKHEISAIRQRAKSDGYIPVVIRVKRTGIEKPPYDHRSETEQAGIKDDIFDFVVENYGTLSEYHASAIQIAISAMSDSYSPKVTMP